MKMLQGSAPPAVLHRVGHVIFEMETLKVESGIAFEYF